MIVEPGVIAIAGVGLLFMLVLGHATRSTRLLWLDTVITGATEDLRTVETRRLTAVEYKHMTGRGHPAELDGGEIFASLRGIEPEMSDVWEFQLQSKGGSIVTWYMRPETKEFLMPYTKINSGRERIDFKYKDKLKDIGSQAYIMHKMTH